MPRNSDSASGRSDFLGFLEKAKGRVRGRSKSPAPSKVSSSDVHITIPQSNSPSTSTSGKEQSDPTATREVESPCLNKGSSSNTTITNNNGPSPSNIVLSHSHKGEKVNSIYWEKARDELSEHQLKALDDLHIDYINPFEDEIKRVRDLKVDRTSQVCTGKGGKTVMTRGRIHNILKKMEKYAIIGDIMIQHHPDVTALVWAGVRFCLQVALNDMQTFEAVSSTLEDIANIMGSCRIYEEIHSPSSLKSSKAVIDQIPRLYAVCLKFMAETIIYFDTNTTKRVGKGITNPFEVKFKPLIEDVDDKRRELERRVGVANDELQDKMDQDQRRGFQELSGQLDYFRVDMLDVRSGVERLLKQVDDEKRRKAMIWLSNLEFENPHERARKSRFNDTGRWLFEKPEFVSWIENQDSSVLWLNGKAGSGKTVLSSHVVDTLTVTYPAIPIIYFYCNYGEEKWQTTSSIVRSLLKQLSIKFKSLDPRLLDIFDNGTSLSLDKSEELFAAALLRTETTFVVVDALDECSKEERKSLVELLKRQLYLDCNVKIFLASRDESDLRGVLMDSISYRINADDTATDITPFVTAKIDDLIQTRQILHGNVSPSLKKDLVETISGEADGMFLWAKFQLEHICNQGNEAEVRSQLRKLPRGLNKTYDRIWTKITVQFDDTERKWALKVLKWVLCALEPLKPSTMIEATAVEPLDEFFDRKKTVSSVEYLLGVCGGFVALDEKTDVLRFVHYSVQEFLKTKLSSAGDLVAGVCLTVLGFTKDVFPSRNNIYEYAVFNWQEHVKDWREIDDHRDALLRKFFVPSCFAEWEHRRCGSRSGQKLKWFPRFNPETIGRSFSTPDQAVSYFNLPVLVQYLQKNSQIKGFDLEIPRSLCIAAYQGHIDVVSLLLKFGTDVNVRLGNWGTALQTAAAGGNDKVIELLLETGANPNVQETFGIGIFTNKARKSDDNGARMTREVECSTALQAASMKGALKAVDLLLNAGANVNFNDENGTALQLAVAGGHEDVIQLLLKANANVNTERVTVFGEWRTALQAAAANGHEKVFELLLKADANPNIERKFHVEEFNLWCSKIKYYTTALHAAALRGLEKGVRLLLDAGVDANVNSESGTALQIAATEGHEKIVQLLIEAKADVNIRAEDGGTALEAAASKGFGKISEMLLKAGANPRCPNNPLRAAAASGLEKIVVMLLDAGAHIGEPGDGMQGSTLGNIMRMAARGGYQTITKLLLNSGADINTSKQGDGTQESTLGGALRAAARGGYQTIVKLLLDAGTDINDRSDWETALIEATNFSHREIVEMLLNAGANVNARSGHRKGTVLQIAISRGDEDLVKLFLKANADPNLEQDFFLDNPDYGFETGLLWEDKPYEDDDDYDPGCYNTALQVAARKGSEEIVKLLLSAGANVDQGGRFGTPLYLAARSGHERVVELLLEASANYNIRCGELGTALEGAIQGLNVDVVTLLLNIGADLKSLGDELMAAGLDNAIHPHGEKMVELLLNAGADPNTQFQANGSVLQKAVYEGNEGIVRLLLNANAAVNSEFWFDKNGYWWGGLTPSFINALQVAALGGHREILELLLDAGADVNMQGGKYSSALQGAAAKGHEDIVKLLLKAKANVNDTEGKYGSALQAAKVKGHWHIVELLVNNGAIESNKVLGEDG